jgi:hypothetical protein
LFPQPGKVSKTDKKIARFEKSINPCMGGVPDGRCNARSIMLYSLGHNPPVTGNVKSGEWNLRPVKYFMTNPLYIFVGLLTLLGLVLLWMGIHRLVRRRFVGGGLSFVLGACLLAIAAGTLGAAANLYTYQRLTQEQPVGMLVFERYAPQEFIATLSRPGKPEQQFSILGDECQLDARILKWQGMGTLLGLDTLFRLERIGGRYRETGQDNNKPRSVYPLAEQAGIEFWSLVNRFDRWLPWVDAVYGNAVYVPMADDAEFSISMTTSGLVARPRNSVAEQTIRNW